MYEIYDIGRKTTSMKGVMQPSNVTIYRMRNNFLYVEFTWIYLEYDT